MLRIYITLMQIRIRIQILPFTLIRTPNPDPSFQINAQYPIKVFKYAHVPYILACHLKIDLDPDPYPAYQFDAEPDLQHCTRTTRTFQ